MNLDVKTLFMVVTLGYFTGALILAVLAVSVRSIPGTIRTGWSLWAVCMFLSGSAALLIGQRGSIPDYLSIIAANAFLTIGFGLRPNAIALLNSRKMPYLYVPVLGTLGWLGLYGFEFFRQDIMLRVFYINGFCLAGVLLCLWQSWQLNRRQISSWLLVMAFALDSVVRISLIGTHLQRQFPTLLESYETLPLQICMLVLIVAIVVKIVGISISIFEMQQRQYRDESEKDALTGLFNQRGFRRAVKAQFANRDATSAAYALVLMEIDNAGSIDKRYGSSMTDAFLNLLAKISRMTVPAEVVAGITRNGQIALFLPQSDQTGANSYTSRISKMLIMKSKSASASQVSATLSAGVFSGTKETPVERALEIAGHCLRKAQQTGGNKIMAHEADGGIINAQDIETPFALRAKETAIHPAQ